MCWQHPVIRVIPATSFYAWNTQNNWVKGYINEFTIQSVAPLTTVNLSRLAEDRGEVIFNSLILIWSLLPWSQEMNSEYDLKTKRCIPQILILSKWNGPIWLEFEIRWACLWYTILLRNLNQSFKPVRNVSHSSLYSVQQCNRHNLHLIYLFDLNNNLINQVKLIYWFDYIMQKFQCRPRCWHSAVWPN